MWAAPGRQSAVVPVAVQSEGYPVPFDDAAQRQEVAGGVLLLSEQRNRRRADGVVDGEEQGEPRAPALQPIVNAPVDLRQHPFLGHALPSDPAIPTRRDRRGLVNPAPTGRGAPWSATRYHQYAT